MNNNLSKLFHILFKNKYSVLLFVFCSFIFLAIQVPKIKSDYSVQYWFKKSDPLIQKLKVFEQTFGNEQNIIVIIDHPNSIFNKESLQAINHITQKLPRITDILSSRSITNFSISQAQADEIFVAPIIDTKMIDSFSSSELALLQKKAQEEDLLSNYLVSTDNKTAIIYGFLRPVLNDETQVDYIQIVRAVEKLVAELDLKETKIKLTGSAKFQEEFRKVSEKDLFQITPIMLVLVVIFLFLSFRTLEAVYIPIFLIAICVFSAYGIGALFEIRFENIVSAVPGILFSICIADSVHFLVVYYHQRSSGDSVRDSLEKSFVKNFVPTLLTSITTGIGFYSLLASTLNPIHNLGLLAGSGSLLAWFYTLFLMPIIIDLTSPFETFKIAKKKSQYSLKASLMLPFINKYRYILSISLILLTSGGVYLSFTNDINSNPQEYLSKDVQVRVNTDYIIKKFNGAGGPEIIIDSGIVDGIKDPSFLNKVDQLENWVNELPHVGKTISVLKTIKKMNQLLNQGESSFYKVPSSANSVAEILLLSSMDSSDGATSSDRVSSDYRHLRLSVFWNVSDSKTNLSWYKKVLSKSKELGLNAHITGNSSLANRMNNNIVSTFFNSMGMALILIFIVLSLLFKSVILGFFSMLPNIIPIMLGTAVMALMGHSIEAGAVMVCSVCLGIAVDDTIHFMVNYIRNRKKDMSVIESLKSVLDHTGHALIVTTLILIVGFGVFTTADFIPNIRFGAYSSLVLLLALIVDLVFLPALLLIKDRD